MSHRSKWERRLREVFDEIDDILEDEYGAKYPLHPARARRGRTANKSQDGLFNVGAAYSAGLGSEYGEGYIVEIRLVTLSKVPREIRERIEDEVVELLNEKLPESFPDHDLRVERDGHLYKIVGDLSLGSL